MDKTFEGRISISRCRGASEKEETYDKIHITLEDGKSGCQFLEVSLGLEEYARAISGQGYISCEFEIGNMDVIGKKREVKTEAVPVPDLHLTPELVSEALKPFEIDGWLARSSDLGNHHNIVYETNEKGKKTGLRREDNKIFYWVSFVRFVEDK